MTVAHPPTGTLEIEVSSSSMFLSSALPIEIRDGRHVLIHTFRGRQQASLAPGLYTVTAVLDDGSRESRVTTITAGRKTRVEFDPPVGRWFTEQDISGNTISPMSQFFDVGYRGPMVPLSDEVMDQPLRRSSEIVDGIHLLAVPHQIRVDNLGRGQLAIELMSHTLAWIALRSGPHVVLQTLPLDAKSSPECRRCLVQIDRQMGVRVELPRERRVTNALRGMLEAGNVSDAIELAQRGVELLAAKYSDPIAAAYGGLLLERFGQLTKHAAWLENLSRDFPWIGDGRVLLAAVLSRSDSESERERGWELLLAVTRSPRTMFFSDGFSLLLALLRRWPDRSKRELCDQVLDGLATMIASFDFDATYSKMRLR